MLSSDRSPEAVVRNERALVESLTGADDVAFNDIGFNSRVYVVNGGEFVFKFPRSDEQRSAYRTEVRLLNQLANLDLPVQIPRVRWEEPSLAYVGYIGVVARDSSELAVDAERARKFGEAVGSFLRVLHAQECDVPTYTVEDEIAKYQARHRSVLPVLETSFSAEELRVLDDFFRREMPATMRSVGEDLRVCHGDLGPWNVIIGPDDTVGVIDFGEAGYWDQSKDFVALPSPHALEAAYHAYGDSQALRDKVAIRRRAFPITDLPYFIGIGDANGIKARLGEIRGEFFGADAEL